ncbi:hypothetical protein AB4259_18230 [Vibrio amylolyticus]|uniref:hypothetical protein n=1 Tax=Vibrio amylolyticus TaxID=2847292 RepID=UPI0035539F34
MERFIKDNTLSINTLEKMTNNVRLYSDLLRPERLFDDKNKPMSIEMAEEALKEFDEYLCVMMAGIENMRDEFLDLEALVNEERAKLDNEQKALVTQDHSVVSIPVNAKIQSSGLRLQVS